MLQIFFAVAFSAVPLTLYLPPIRSLNLFVETLEDLFRQTSVYTLRTYPRIRVALSRIFNSIFSSSSGNNFYHN
ncbi:DIS3-exonuclease-like protein [Melia azedarach]|uniref:DIS3-exonuclease-like protein n=1 Tax=Melia azedarach TaxID=155640 RepID=A0ACC1X5L2_MELAZ|nr:DIS3-exonuclease-like protein [Melia azedarach]